MFRSNSENTGTGVQEKAVKEELQRLKKLGLLENLDTDDESETKSADQTPVKQQDRLSLRYCGCAKPSEMASIIDNGNKDKKIHVWPGCRKMANRADAIRLNIHRFNGLGEDRAQTIFDNGLWCKECNPNNEVLPSSMEQVSW